MSDYKNIPVMVLFIMRHSSVVVSTSALHVVVRGSIPARNKHAILGVKTWLSTLETVSLVGREISGWGAGTQHYRLYLLWGVRSVVGALLQNLGKFVYPHCLYLSDETLYAVAPFYLVSMPGEVKDPTQG